MSELVNFIFHIMKIFNFRHKIAFNAGGAFLKSFSICGYILSHKNKINRDVSDLETICPWLNSIPGAIFGFNLFMS